MEMNRQIKFRAWDKFNDCFHYPASESTASLAKFFTQMADMQAAGNGIIITQYTGLKDKNRAGFVNCTSIYPIEIIGNIYENPELLKP